MRSRAVGLPGTGHDQRLAVKFAQNLVKLGFTFKADARQITGGYTAVDYDASSVKPPVGWNSPG